MEAEKKAYVGPSVLEFEDFESRTHGIANQEGWEDIASFVLEWVGEKTKV